MAINPMRAYRAVTRMTSRFETMLQNEALPSSKIVWVPLSLAVLY